MMINSSLDFSNLALKRFVALNSGAVLHAPVNWRENSDEKVFQVVDPETGLEITSTAYQNPNLSFQQWAEHRMTVVEKELKLLKCVRPPHHFAGDGWSGIASDYEGQFHGAGNQVHYLVIAIALPKLLISLTVVGGVEVYARNEPLILWLLKNKLVFNDVARLADDASGLAALSAAAEAGNADAQFNLAVLYERGHGLAQSEAMAADWYRKAAEQGHANAQFNLGVYHANGTGVKQSYELAAAEWRQAADQDLAEAQYALGMLSLHGLGVEQSNELAVHLFKMAAIGGHKESEEILRTIEPAV